MYHTNSGMPYTWDIFSHQEQKISSSRNASPAAHLASTPSSKALKKRANQAVNKR